MNCNNVVLGGTALACNGRCSVHLTFIWEVFKYWRQWKTDITPEKHIVIECGPDKFMITESQAAWEVAIGIEFIENVTSLPF